MGEIEFGKCEICGKEAPLERTYFYYPIHCECCGSKDKNGQKQHFEMVVHCKDCPAPMPKEIHPLLKSIHGEEHRANITNILPTEIRGQFIINDKIMENVLQQKVVFQQIGNVNMEDFIADLLERIEKGEVEKENVEMQNQVLKQLNNRHKNIIDAQRVMNKCLEIELAHLIKQE